MRLLFSLQIYLLVSAILATFAPQAVFGQPFNLDTPAHSAAWWPLTDDLTATELRAVLRDEEGHRRRYREAVAAGLETPNYPGEADQIVFYVHIEAHPELLTMWWPFTSLADEAHSSGEEHVMSELRQSGLTEVGAEIVLEHATAHRLESERTIDRIRGDTQSLLEIQRSILEASNWDKSLWRKIKKAIKADDAQFFVARSEVARADAERMIGALKVSPLADSAAVFLPALKAALSNEDWIAFRRHLVAVLRKGSVSIKDLDQSR